MKKRGSSSNLRRMGSRSGSSSNLQKLERSKSAADADGFVTVSGKGGGNSNMNRSMSHNALRRSTSEGGWSRRDSSSSSSKLPRSSSGSSFSALMEESKKSKGSKSKSTGEKAPTAATTAAPAPAPAPKKEFKDPQACGKSAVNVFKEYFVGGDTDDAVLSIFELIGSESDAGSLERGVAVVESTCGYVLEGKAEQVDKYLTVLTRCLAEEKLLVKMVEGGICGLLEFLADIIIDAPLAGTHMAKIVGTLMKNNTFQFDSLLNAPEYFRTDGKAAQFAAKVMKQADMMSDADCLEVVEKLMTEEDKESFATAAKLLESV